MARAKPGSSELTKALALSPQPIYLLDSRRVLVYANPACLDWLGCSADDLFRLRCDYHSQAPSTVAPNIAAGLCPPPESLATARCQGIVTAVGTNGTLRRRTADFFPLEVADEADPALLAIVAGADLSGPLPAPPPGHESSSAELHVLLRWLRQTLGARGVLNRWVSDSPASERVRQQFQAAVAARSARVLVVGPPGSDRESLARGIHYSDDLAAAGPLIPLPCALVNAEQLQSAITSLVRHTSDVASPRGATLLVDVDQLSADAQQELAGFLAVPGFQVRTLATASTNLLELAARGTFRRDLAYALSTLVIDLPPLASRGDELPLLVQTLIEEQNASGGPQLGGCTAEALDRLAAYAWPGDMAQLTTAIHEACLASAGPLVTAADLPGWLRLAEDAAAHPRPRDERIVLDDFLAEMERELLSRALARSRGNKAKAAKLLGISRPRLLRRMEQLGLQHLDAR